MADTEASNPGSGASAHSTPGPNFLVGRTAAAAQPARYSDQSEPNEYDRTVKNHRAELDALDVEIGKLDRSIAQEQDRIRQSKSTLDNSYRLRTRLLHLRSAMLNFVFDLEMRQGE